MKIFKEYILKNGKTLIVRSAEKDDAEKELDFYKKEVTETPYLSRGGDDNFPTKEDFEENYQFYLNDARSCTLVAFYDNKLVGTGHIDYCGNKKRAVHKCDVDLGVLKEFWGLGIGGKIMQTLIDCARIGKFEQIELSVASKNERAIKMYELFGFKKVGTMPHAMKYEDGTYADFVNMIKFLL